MAFIVEDGTGIADANSYVDVAYADAYFLDRANSGWSSADTSSKEIALVKATDYVEIRFRDKWKGILAPEATTLSFPRQYLYNRKGELETGIPEDVKKAVCEYAVRALSADLLPDPTVSDSAKALKKTFEKVGPIETEVEYQDGSARPDIIRPYPAADRLLTFWTTSVGGVIR
ncbi:MAG: hypothetical protein Unbinned200contig1000_14 [Prokaryotic dsDNA virus sp.]|jgi:hypothetical protein|nr:hypothetical protein [Flavobacteriaceae bacterium]QDP65274.1 MAG: hypothetical protein Unbinned200contig1000_14 [Prokaryotic dsDNA virus sp.]|tara:strand:+ start:22575 stop:23093 length:519 start_codon:yes stop_codon:yes gene_type:complete